ncbi:hypothetical protein LT330_005629 [Penicillium expansum]|nr:hypothetical protein LT330_005629 [Penicillium expansum]
MAFDQDNLRSRFCHALSEMYKSEVPLYGDLIDVVWEADAKTVQNSQNIEGDRVINPDDILPARHRVERHGAIRLGTAHELATVRRMFAVMGMHPVGYYDLSVAGFPMHATAFRPNTQEALEKNPFRVFTTVLRMELLTERTRELAQKALEQRNIFTPRLLALLDIAESQGFLTPDQCTELISNGLETFRWHSKATVTLQEYEHLKAEHPLIADIVSFPSSHINHLTPRTIDIDLVQQLMLDHGMPAKDRIEGPPKRLCPILLRQTSFKALEETVYFRDPSGSYVKGSHTARFGEVEQRGYALTREGRQLYDQILERVNAEAAKNGLKGKAYDTLLEERFKEFPDSLSDLHDQRLGYFTYRLTPLGDQLINERVELSEEQLPPVSLQDLLNKEILSYEAITYEDFLPLSAGGIFNSNLGGVSQSKQLIMGADSDLDGFQRLLGACVADEFHLYAEMQRKSLEVCRQKLRALRSNSTSSQTLYAFNPTDRPLEVSFSNAVHAFGTWCQKASVSLGMRQIDGFNIGGSLGSVFATFTIDPQNTHRSSFESSFIQAVLGKGVGPTVYKSTMAQKILFDDDNKRVTGVQVILSASAFQSPQPLMISAIGPCGNLRSLAALGAKQYRENSTGAQSIFGPGYYSWEKLPDPFRSNLTRKFRLALSSFPFDWPELEWLPISAFNGYNLNKVIANAEDGHQYAPLSGSLTAPLSRGSLRLAGPGMKTPPLIDPQWFVDPTDMNLAIQAFKRQRQIWTELAKLGVAEQEEYFPGFDVSTDAQILKFIHQSMTTIYQASATCYMGRENDTMAVIDNHANVYGVQGLNVVDASSFPFLPRGHPRSVVYAFAEKIAGEILSFVE